MFPFKHSLCNRNNNHKSIRQILKQLKVYNTMTRQNIFK